VKSTRRHASFVQRGPEAIAGPCEVVPHRGAVQAGVDAHEQHVEVVGEHVGQQAVPRSFEVGDRRRSELHPA
jgi:hypothetical protein